MSLLPKLPCRRLFIDSRFAEGTATDFVVNIPEAGLDLGDNTVCYVDSISVPSIQNVLPTRSRIYYREQTTSSTRLLMVDIPVKHYGQADLVSTIQSALNGNPSKLLASTYEVSFDSVATCSSNSSAAKASRQI